jgi:hypothetical protein
VQSSERDLDSLVAGLWIIIGRNSVVAREVIDKFDEIQMGHECVYSLPDLELTSKERSACCVDHFYGLTIFKRTSSLLDRKITVLRKNELGYLVFDLEE